MMVIHLKNHCQNLDYKYIVAHKLFSNAGFDGRIIEDEVVATFEMGDCKGIVLHSEFEEIPYATGKEFVRKIK